MCSVRVRPMPWAPNRTARAESSPLSALVRTFSRRCASACWMIACTAADQLVGGRVEPALEVLDHRGGDDRDLAQVDRAGRAVDRDHVALADDRAVGQGELLAGHVDLELVGAADAGLAHAAGDDGRVAGLAAAAGQDAAGGDHAVQVVGVGLAPDQDDRLALGGPGHRRGRVEHGLADGRARRGADALGDPLDVGLGVEAREHQLGELVAGDPAQRLVQVDHALLDELDARSGTRPRRCACRPGSAASTACRARW